MEVCYESPLCNESVRFKFVQQVEVCGELWGPPTNPQSIDGDGDCHAPSVRF